MCDENKGIHQMPGQAARLGLVPKINYSIPEAAHAAGVGRSTLYEAIAAGALRSSKVGKRRLIPVAALNDWLAGHEVVS